ncbi:MAG: phosphate acyltransferase PlsX [Mogibacterium sp.]|nr:phosphate acyltransferase PlsX [Mogibacterium sp.]
MKIIIDGMGGDYAPQAIVKGAVKAAAEIDETIVIVGPEELIRNCLNENNYSGSNIEIVNATEVISNNEPPAMAIRRKKDSTIVKGMNMVKNGEGDVFISGGSTGALLSGGLTTIGRIKGIRRPAIAAWFPKLNGKGTTLLLDCGASVEPKPEYLLQNGIMGSIFVNAVKGVDSPDVRLLNIGAEEGKGDDLHKEAYKLLAASDINFNGNIEGRDVAETECDVVVTDGFSGNIFLKSSEGVALAIMNQFKSKLMDGILAKAGALLAYGKIKELKALFDYSDVGGAPILGLKGPVVKIHGNSKETEVYYAIHKAVPFVRNDVTGMIAKAINDNAALFQKDKTEEDN